jgi:ABC-type branched-subunit amino acid transport system ATPase component
VTSKANAPGREKRDYLFPRVHLVAESSACDLIGGQMQGYRLARTLSVHPPKNRGVDAVS